MLNFVPFSVVLRSWYCLGYNEIGRYFWGYAVICRYFVAWKSQSTPAGGLVTTLYVCMLVLLYIAK